MVALTIHYITGKSRGRILCAECLEHIRHFPQVKSIENPTEIKTDEPCDASNRHGKWETK